MVNLPILEVWEVWRVDGWFKASTRLEDVNCFEGNLDLRKKKKDFLLKEILIVDGKCVCVYSSFFLEDMHFFDGEFECV